MKYRTKSLIRYWFKAGHRKGHGIHSPFLYRLISSVIENKDFFSAYRMLEEAQTFLLHATQSKSVGKNQTNHLPDLDLRFGKLIFRLVNEFQPKIIGYYGASFGTNLLYLALADSRIKVNTYIPDNVEIKVCEKLLAHFEIKNVVLNKEPQQFQENFVLINFPDDAFQSSEIIKNHLKNSGNDDVVIVQGIHQSPEKEVVWLDYIKNEKIRVSLDLFEIGIAIFRSNLQKEDFILKF
jgi:hypothetical protein